VALLQHWHTLGHSGAQYAVGSLRGYYTVIQKKTGDQAPMYTTGTQKCN
jgi:hypothetical protein